MIPAFPKIIHYGDRMAANAFNGPVEISEKVDGSQFSFGRVDGEIQMRSKNAEVFFDDANGMFNLAKKFVGGIESLLPNNVVFHGEYLQKNQHNTLNYHSVPKGNFCLFGITYVSDEYEPFGAPAEQRAHWAEVFNCDAVPVLFEGEAPGPEARYEWAMSFMRRESYLGGPEAEGIVIKNYNQPIELMGKIIPYTSIKLVSNEFKEKHGISWKEGEGKTSLDRIAESYRASPRWVKAIQSLGEQGLLTGTPKDIGPLLKAINIDIATEEKENIKELLWSLFSKDILRIATKGFPEFYKDRLNRELLEAA